MQCMWDKAFIRRFDVYVHIRQMRGSANMNIITGSAEEILHLTPLTTTSAKQLREGKSTSFYLSSYCNFVLLLLDDQKLSMSTGMQFTKYVFSRLIFIFLNSPITPTREVD